MACTTGSGLETRLSMYTLAFPAYANKGAARCPPAVRDKTYCSFESLRKTAAPFLKFTVAFRSARNFALSRKGVAPSTR